MLPRCSPTNFHHRQHFHDRLGMVKLVFLRRCRYDIGIKGAIRTSKWTLFAVLFLVFVLDKCCGHPVAHGSASSPAVAGHHYQHGEEPPSNSSISRVKRAFYYDNKLLTYLQSFGYLPEADRETGNLRTEDQLHDAIRNLQAFASLPTTGLMDEETKRLLRKPRCGIPDIPLQHGRRKKRFTIHGQKWHYKNLTWSLQTQRLTALDHGNVRRELSRALDLWAQNSQLTFQEVNSQNADILIYFQRGYHGDGYPFDGRGLILAHAFFPGPGRGGDAHFDEDEIWQLEGDSNDVGGTSLFAVAAHEFGHSLGLSHSSVSGALMYPWYQGLRQNYELPEDDRHGIQQLYGSKGKLWAKIPVYNPGPRDNDYPRREPPSNTTPRSRTTQAPTTVPPPPTTTPHPRGDKPDTCDTSYDAISVIRSQVFIFKGKYMWRIGDKGLQHGYPALIVRLWNNLPKNLTRVDAVYERLDKKIVFFIGREYYLFHGNTLEKDYPKPLTALGLPKSLDHIDAAMIWGHNSKTYFFSGTMYWRYDEEVLRVELDYPRDMAVWRGIGYYIDTVFQWKDGATYFFKGKGFWKFNDLRMKVESERQTLSAPFWMGCPGKEHDKPHHNKPIDRTKITKTSDGNNEVTDDDDNGSTTFKTSPLLFYSITVVYSCYLLSAIRAV